MKVKIKGIEFELGKDSKKDYNASTLSAVAFFLNPLTGVFACLNAYRALKAAEIKAYEEAGKYYSRAKIWSYITFVTVPLIIGLIIYIFVWTVNAIHGLFAF